MYVVSDIFKKKKKEFYLIVINVYNGKIEIIVVNVYIGNSEMNNRFILCIYVYIDWMFFVWLIGW